MNKNFVKITDINSIPDTKGKKISIGKKSIALFKYGGKIFAIQNSCPHQGANLADGHVKEGKAVCPLHNWAFDLESGAFSGNENICIPTYQTKVKNNEVYILMDID